MNSENFENVKVGDIVLKVISSWGCKVVHPLVCTYVCGNSRYFNYANDLDNTDYCCNGYVIHNIQEFIFSNIYQTGVNYFDIKDEFSIGMAENGVHFQLEHNTINTWVEDHEQGTTTLNISPNKYEICDKCGGFKKIGHDCRNCLVFAIKPYDYKGYTIQLDKPSRTNKGEEDLFIGFELEFEMTNTKRNAKEKLALKIKELLPNFVLECKRDGSLNNGFEVLSQPIHINRINTPWYTNRIKSLFDLLKEEGCVAEDTCGLHFHLSNAGLGDIRRTQNNMLLLTDTLQEYIKRWSNRLTVPKAVYREEEGYDEDDCCFEVSDDEYGYGYGRNVFNYCRFVNDNFWTDTDEQRASWYDRHEVSHYNGVNIENTNTTEFRFFSSTLDEFEFMTDVNLLMAITRICKKESVNRIRVSDIINKVSSVYRERLMTQVMCLGLDRIVYDYDVEKVAEKEKTDIVGNMWNLLCEIENYVHDNFHEDVFFRRWLLNMGLHSNIFGVQCEISKYKIKPSANKKSVLKRNWKDMIALSTSLISYLNQPTTSIIINTKNEKPTQVTEFIKLLESVESVR